ncbi:penicillin-binding protein 2, partial [Candidatus Desantisbacteria bacterium]|nr:penicillin-binding protein 2 [Candidatus Desantisbacteria bacterium]
RRDYIRGEFGAHFFGYLGKINDNELKKSEYSNYRQDDTIGKTGLEKKYEKFLRGKDGKRIIEVNAIGQQLGTNVIDDPVPGYNLILTIDKNLQEVAEKAMEGKTGAIVALDPRSGEILAMVSKPGFNPNLFAGQISSELWKELNDNPMHPLINRTIMGAYPPGSTFKILIAITALEEKVIDAEFTEECLGEFIYGNAKYKCWKKEGHGRINVTEALINSCNIFFYKLGLNAGIKKVEKYALMFGLGKATGIDLSQERNGLVPNPSWKKSATKLPWYPGDNILIGVGQGALLVTPVQMANMISLIVNGGVLWQPHLVREVVSVNNRIIYKIPRKEISKINISAKTLEIIRDALWKVVNRWGTGRRTRIPGLNILGKTGTAQMAAKQDYYDDIETNKIPEQIRPHAWFVTCAPMKDPKIAIAILIEHGGEGGQSSAPIAKLMYDEYLKEEKRDYSLDKIHNPGDIPKPKDESMINLTHEPFYLFDSSQINPIIKNIVLETRE